MATTIGPGMGCILKIDGTAIGEAVAISGPTYTRVSIPTTHLNSTDDFRTKMKGISDAGEFGVTVNWDGSDAGHVKIMAEVQGANDAPNATLKTYILSLKNDGTPSTFSVVGAVSACAWTGMEVDGVVQAEITIKLSGTPTFVA